MCEIGGGVIVLRPGPDERGYEFAADTVGRVAERYGASIGTNLASELDRDLPSVWDSPNGSIAPHRHGPVPQRFTLEHVAVEPGTELMFADELRSAYYEPIFSHPLLFDEVANGVRLAVSPNWRYFAGAVSDGVSEPFMIGTNHAHYLAHLGIPDPPVDTGAGVRVAVLDNGFDPAWWQGLPSSTRIGSGIDLVDGDASTRGHGTLITALVASVAPGASIEPVRMAGSDSTEWDVLHAIARAVRFGADVVTLAYRQILQDAPCSDCGRVRQAARSEVFRTFLEWACQRGTCAFVTAAGNDGFGMVALPAAYPGAIPVAALNEQCNALAPFSNWDGSGVLSVLAAPGEDVAESPSTGQKYGGTSFATAYAAGVFALAKERSPGAMMRDIADLVRRPMVISNAHTIGMFP
jgi:hypothetical protein